MTFFLIFRYKKFNKGYDIFRRVNSKENSIKR